MSSADNDFPDPRDMAAIFGAVATSRLRLRRPQLEDSFAMFAVHGDPATNLYNPFGPDPDQAASDEGLLRRPDLDTEHLIYALGWESA